MIIFSHTMTMELLSNSDLSEEDIDTYSAQLGGVMNWEIEAQRGEDIRPWKGKGRIVS